MDALTPTQEIALAQLQTITNGESDVAKSVLESVGWDVQVLLFMLCGASCTDPSPLQRAAELVFDTAPAGGPSTAPRSHSPRRRMESLELDDSRQGDVQASRRRRRVSLDLPFCTIALY